MNPACANAEAKKADHAANPPSDSANAAPEDAYGAFSIEEEDAFERLEEPPASNAHASAPTNGFAAIGAVAKAAGMPTRTANARRWKKSTSAYAGGNENHPQQVPSDDEPSDERRRGIRGMCRAGVGEETAAEGTKSPTSFVVRPSDTPPREGGGGGREDGASFAPLAAARRAHASSFSLCRLRAAA